MRRVLPTRISSMGRSPFSIPMRGNEELVTDRRIIRRVPAFSIPMRGNEIDHGYAFRPTCCATLVFDPHEG